MLDGVVPFPSEFVERYRAKGYWEDRSLASVFADVFTRFAERVALVAGSERIIYRELAGRVERLARHFLKLEIRPLDRVVVQLPNVPEFVYVYFALQRVGAIPVMALLPHRYREIKYYVELTEAVAYVIPDRAGDFDFIELARRIKTECPSLLHVVVAGEAPRDTVSLARCLASESNVPASALCEAAIDPMDPAVLQLSGGTTGVPKLIPRLHNDYVYNSKTAATMVDVRPDDALLVVLPIAHNLPLACPGIQGFFLRGARAVLSTSVRAGDVFPLIERERVTHSAVVPALLIRWINDPAISRYDLSSVRVIQSGGQRLQPEVKRLAEERIPGAIVQENFGMAEGMLTFVRLDDPYEVRLETVGRPMCPDDEVKLVDDEGREVPDGEVGELAVRGPYTLRGYYRAPEHNARVFTPDGFYLSGDLMRRHPSGNFIVEGRKKDLINRGGEKISAEEIENLILSHPAVQNVACVPMPDPILGERTCAFIVPRRGQRVTLPEIVQHLNEAGIARFKLPERVELIDELPLSPFGKVSKVTLIKLIAEKLSPTKTARG
ncbi:MAG: 2,3-dihydroxybenzoate-AMP ligase [Candidatus Rokubacteria bacterium 13_1_40CM_68_15]|nr:MAG: 2,3-dihydroxybenzoate-AMP ligase [Candidatus Rokubacteria bacterium 13_1_40CM_68_15]